MEGDLRSETETCSPAATHQKAGTVHRHFGTEQPHPEFKAQKASPYEHQWKEVQIHSSDL